MTKLSDVLQIVPIDSSSDGEVKPRVNAREHFGNVFAEEHHKPKVFVSYEAYASECKRLGLTPASEEKWKWLAGMV